MYDLLWPPLKSSKNTDSSVSFCHPKHITVSLQKPSCLQSHTARGSVHMACFPEPPAPLDEPSLQYSCSLSVLIFIISVLVT